MAQLIDQGLMPPSTLLRSFWDVAFEFVWLPPPPTPTLRRITNSSPTLELLASSPSLSSWHLCSKGPRRSPPISPRLSGRWPQKQIWAASWQKQQNGCAPSKDSDQTGHLPSLFRVFAVRSMGSYGSKLSSCGQQKTLIRLGECPGWSESSLGAQSFCWFCHEVAHIKF